MDRNERINDSVTALQIALSGWQQKMWTALPGTLQSFDVTKMSAVVQPTIQAQLQDSGVDGKWTDVTMPLCLDCPVVFPSGGGYGMTLPLSEGDEGLLVFSSRCIDAWWQNGGVQPQAEYRMHDLSDGFFVPGVFSNSRVPANVSSTVARFWKLDGTMLVELGDAGVLTLRAPAEILLDAPITRMTGTFSAAGGSGPTGVVTGDLHVSGTVTGDGDVVAGGISGKTHHHGGVQSGGGNSGPPLP